MVPSSPRITRKRADGATALALAAGMAFGHIVAAMAAQDRAGVATLVAAFVFVAAGSAGTVCALVQLSHDGNLASGRRDVVRWIFALGLGLVGALSPSFF